MPTGIGIHKLSNVNPESRTADCAKCGSVEVRRKGKSLRCVNGIAAAKHAHRTSPTAKIKRENPCAVCGESNPLKLHVDTAGTGVLCTPHQKAAELLGHDVEQASALLAYLQK